MQQIKKDLFLKIKKGFTLIELMIVVFIIALVGTIATVSTGVIRRSANDKKTISNVLELQMSLEAYKLFEGQYPDKSLVISGEQLIGSTTGKIFHDKIPDNVLYILPSQDYYEIEFTLGGSVDNFTSGLNWVGPDRKISNKDKKNNRRSIYFNGVNDYLEVIDSSSLDINNKITISAWIKPEILSPSSANRVVIKPTAAWSEPYYVYSLFVGVNGLGFGISNGTTRRWAWKGSLSVNNWQHVAATYDGQVMRWYINGVQVGSQLENINIGTNNFNLTIGRALDSSTFFKGLIDEVYIYNRALSIEEINLIKNGFKISNLGLSSYWSMDEGDTCVSHDYSGNGNSAFLKPNCPSIGPDWNEAIPY